MKKRNAARLESWVPMNRAEAQKILSAYRPDDADPADPFFAEALRAAAEEAELSRWWVQEQIFDRAIAGKVHRMPVSKELKSQLLRSRSAIIPFRARWAPGIALLAAVLALLAVIFGYWHTSPSPAASLADYRDEMVSFVRFMPPLDFETSELTQLLAHLEKTGAPVDLALPAKLRTMEPAGCRTLRFRGHDVTLICFKRADGRRAHLFVMKDAALPRMPGASGREIAATGEWMTAAWSEGGQTYLFALEGDRHALERYFTVS